MLAQALSTLIGSPAGGLRRPSRRLAKLAGNPAGGYTLIRIGDDRGASLYVIQKAEWPFKLRMRCTLALSLHRTSNAKETMNHAQQTLLDHHLAEALTVTRTSRPTFDARKAKAFANFRLNRLIEQAATDDGLSRRLRLPSRATSPGCSQKASSEFEYLCPVTPS